MKHGSIQIIPLIILTAIAAVTFVISKNVENNQELRGKAQTTTCEISYGGQCVPNNYVCSPSRTLSGTCLSGQKCVLETASCNPPASNSTPTPIPTPPPSDNSCGSNGGQCVPNNYSCNPPQTSSYTCASGEKCVGEAANCRAPVIPTPIPSPDPTPNRTQCDLNNGVCIPNGEYCSQTTNYSCNSSNLTCCMSNEVPPSSTPIPTPKAKCEDIGGVCIPKGEYCSQSGDSNCSSNLLTCCLSNEIPPTPTPTPSPTPSPSMRPACTNPNQCFPNSCPDNGYTDIRNIQACPFDSMVQLVCCSPNNTQDYYQPVGSGPAVAVVLIPIIPKENNYVCHTNADCKSNNCVPTYVPGAIVGICAPEGQKPDLNLISKKGETCQTNAWDRICEEGTKCFRNVCTDPKSLSQDPGCQDGTNTSTSCISSIPWALYDPSTPEYQAYSYYGQANPCDTDPSSTGCFEYKQSTYLYTLQKAQTQSDRDNITNCFYHQESEQCQDFMRNNSLIALGLSGAVVLAPVAPMLPGAASVINTYNTLTTSAYSYATVYGGTKLATTLAIADLAGTGYGVAVCVIDPYSQECQMFKAAIIGNPGLVTEGLTNSLSTIKSVPSRFNNYLNQQINDMFPEDISFGATSSTLNLSEFNPQYGVLDYDEMALELQRVTEQRGVTYRNVSLEEINSFFTDYPYTSKRTNTIFAGAYDSSNGTIYLPDSVSDTLWMSNSRSHESLHAIRDLTGYRDNIVVCSGNLCASNTSAKEQYIMSLEELQTSAMNLNLMAKHGIPPENYLFRSEEFNLRHYVALNQQALSQMTETERAFINFYRSFNDLRNTLNNVGSVR